MFRLVCAFVATALLAVAATSCSSASIGCETDDQCRDGRICNDGKCQAPGAGNNVSVNNADNATANNGTANNLNHQTNLNNNTLNNLNNPPNNNIPDPDFELCARFCDLLLGSCVDRTCDISPEVRAALDGYVDICMFTGFEPGEPGCVEAIATQPGFRDELGSVLNMFQCEGPELEEFRCTELDLGPACGCDPIRFNDVGQQCMSADDCDGGGLPGICATPENEPPFPDGYCVSFGCPVNEADPKATVDPICGEGNVCLPIDGDGGLQGLCLDGCFAHDDCRPQYQCRLVGADPSFNAVRVCLPECGPSLACQNPAERCNQGRCEIPCTETGQPPGRRICEGLGFECVPDDAGEFWCEMP